MFLQRYWEEDDEFDRIVSGDETWVQLVNAETKEQSKQWMHMHSPNKPKKNKRCGMVTKGVVLLHNTRPHTAAHKNALIKLFNWEIFDHPPYNPDLVPSVYHLFTKMKVYLATQRFHTNEELTDGVNNWLHNLAAPFLDEGLQKLVLQYDKCLNVDGTYMEK